MIETKQKIVNWEQAVELVNSWKSEGQQVVFTNGCFDILHPGHIDYMEKARNMGQKLVVGLNSDASISRLKGPERPVNTEQVRAIMLAALAFVDAVVVFAEDTPLKLIETLVPDILVKGNDYDISNIVGADFVISHGGKVETVAMVNGFSTTNFIAKIKKLN